MVNLFYYLFLFHSFHNFLLLVPRGRYRCSDVITPDICAAKPVVLHWLYQNILTPRDLVTGVPEGWELPPSQPGVMDYLYQAWELQAKQSGEKLTWETKAAEQLSSPPVTCRYGSTKPINRHHQITATQSMTMPTHSTSQPSEDRQTLPAEVMWKMHNALPQKQGRIEARQAEVEHTRPSQTEPMSHSPITPFALCSDIARCHAPLRYFPAESPPMSVLFPP